LSGVFSFAVFPSATIQRGVTMVDENRPHAAGQNSFRARVRVGLFVILALMIAAGLYEFLLARPGVDAAYERIDKANSVALTAANGGSLTPERVHEVVGSPPSREVDLKDQNGNQYQMEVYTWRGGLPWRTYNVYVVYRRGMFLAHYQNENPREDVERGPPFPGGTPPPPGPDDVDEIDDDDLGDDDDDLGDDDDGDRPEGGRRGPFDFAQLDANGDEKLTSDELPEQFRDRLLQSADADGDGAITKEEFENRPRRGGPRSGGPGRGGRGPGADEGRGEGAAKPAGDEKPAEKPGEANQDRSAPKDEP
jgi:hypothetical protein